MPRTRTIRRPSIKTGRKTKSRRTQKSPVLSFLPEWLQAFIARRFLDIIALVFTLGGIFMLLSLISYDSADPSWNTASSAQETNDIANWMGASGAGIADLIVQTLGAAGFAISLIITLWGIRLFNRQPLKPFWLRVITLLGGTLLAAMAFAQIPSGDWSPQAYLGGTLGTMIIDNLGASGQNISPYLGYKALAIVSSILALPLLVFAASMSRKEMAIISQNTVFLIKSITALLISFGVHFYHWVAHFNDSSYKPQPFKALQNTLQQQAKTAPKITNTHDTENETTVAATTPQTRTPEPAPKENAVSIPVVKPEQRKTTKPSTPDSQQHFSLAEGEEWEFPPLTLLDQPPEGHMEAQLDENALRKNAELLQNVLADFNVEGEITSIHPGPVVTLYELEPAPGVKSAKVISLADDIARSMSAISVRVAVVPGRNVIGIELPNKNRQIVYMRELIASRMFEKTSANLPLILGKDIGGQPILADLAKMPHLLVAGTTGSGKSVAVNTMILSILYSLSPEQCRFIMIDPKMLELSVYDDIPHLLSPVVTEPGKAVVALKWTVNEMEERYRAMSKLGVRNIEGYNARIREAKKKGETIMNKVQTGFDAEGQPTFADREMDLKELPYIVVVVDEFADLMLVAGKDVESAIQRLAQMARAAGIHLIMATQRPSVDVITGVIKANFPTRISFQVTSKVDSRTILGEGGAEQLLGMGDMLYMAPGGRITRVHGPFVSDSNVETVVADLKAKASPAYVQSVTDEDGIEGSEVMNAMFSGGTAGSGGSDVDELYDEAVAIVAREGRASTSFIQRCLQIGYNRAARIIEEMEKQGVVSKANATGKREVLVGDYSDV